MALAGAGMLSACTSRRQECEADALTSRAVVDQSAFTGWLAEHRVRGAVTEVGWPAGDGWERLADTWLGRARAARLEVFGWAAAAWWPVDYPLALYRSDRRPGARGADTLTVASRQAELLERYLTDELDGGVALADASFGTDAAGGFSASHPGAVGRDYVYPNRESLEFLADRGVRRVRLAVRWERLQPAPGADLDKAAVSELRSVLANAAGLGIGVLVDLHNYGRYTATGGSPSGGDADWTLGSDVLPAAALADVWARLSGALMGSSAVVGYELMNEPHDLPGGARTWEGASIEAVRAIRRVQPEAPVYVAGYDWSSAGRFIAAHPRPWVPADLGEVTYVAHQYFDADGSGTYAEPYEAADAAAQAAGWTRCRPVS